MSGRFAVAFWILGVQRGALVIDRTLVEAHTSFYLVRLFAFLLILVAIVDKNRGRGGIEG
jgi:Family of unknown function (DUF5985)